MILRLVLSILKIYPKCTTVNPLHFVNQILSLFQIAQTKNTPNHKQRHYFRSCLSKFSAGGLKFVDYVQ